MSGGFFEYKHRCVSEFADRIKEVIENRDKSEFVAGFSAKTIEGLRECELLVRGAAVALERVDYLMSCDDSEESFQKRLVEEMDDLAGAYYSKERT